MAHEIDMTTGTAAIAYVGEKPWHGLGAELKQGTSIEEWIKAAQMNWDVVGTPVRNGLGAESGRGTAWNVLNAVTEKYTHGTPRRNASQQFVNSIYGGDANVKDKALDRLLAYV